MLFMHEPDKRHPQRCREPLSEVAVMVRRVPVRDYYEDDFREDDIYEDDERVRKRCRTRTGRRPRAARAIPRRMTRHRLEQ